MSDRYLDVEVVLNSVEGLKIPNSSIIKEELYAIPVDYAVESDEAVSGVAFNKISYDKDSDRETPDIITPTICYVDDAKEYYYVSKLDVEKGDMFVKSSDTAREVLDSGVDTYTVSKSKKFEGVYTINKGFAQFVVIDNLYQADDFCIAKCNAEYGISQYDHVVLDCNSIKEGQIIY